MMALLASGLGAFAGDLLAGAAKVSITPDLDEFPWTAHGERPFNGIHDSIYARALVLDDGATRFALVELDLTAVPSYNGFDQSLVKGAAAAGKLTENHVIIVTSHTHNTILSFFHGGEPDAVVSRELQRVSSAVSQAVSQAAAQLVPATIAFGRGAAYVNVNNGEAKGQTNEFDPEGASSKVLDVIRVADRKGDPLALLVNYASHAEVMFRSATKDGGYEISGDLPGAVAHLLEGSASGAPVVLTTAGAEGDQITILKSRQLADAFPASDEGAGGWSVLNLLSRRLANAVVDVAEALPAGQAQAQIKIASGAFTAPGQRYSPDGNGAWVKDTTASTVTIPLSTVRIGDIALAAVSADIASDIGVGIRASSPMKNTVVLSMMGASVGYVLTDAHYQHLGHAVYGSPVQGGYAEKGIPAAIAGLLRQE
jgi:hypothetical protein